MLSHRIVITIVEPAAGDKALRLLEKTRCEHASRRGATAHFFVDASSHETACQAVEAQLQACCAGWGSALDVEH